jgi:predicted nuclease with TOPRIM domain
MTKRRMTAKAGDDVEESEEEIERLKKEIDRIEEEMKQALDDLEEQWNDIAARTTEIKISPLKKDVVVELFGVAWVPYHLVEAGGRQLRLAGYALPEAR